MFKIKALVDGTNLVRAELTGRRAETRGPVGAMASG